MKISARLRNDGTDHEVQVRTGDAAQSLAISAKGSGGGSSINGGELLMAALATCYCNDLYREAQRLGIAIGAVEGEAEAEFIDRGLSASNVTYRAKVRSPEPADLIEQLLRETDAVAEVHNTLRARVPVQLVPW